MANAATTVSKAFDLKRFFRNVDRQGVTFS